MANCGITFIWGLETEAASQQEEIKAFNWEDIGYAAVVFVYSSYADITVHQISGEGEYNGKKILLYPSNEPGPYGHDIPEIDNAQVFFEGSIKWDGCSNWEFFNENGLMEHFCERKQAVNFGELFSRLYDLGRDLISKADKGAF